MERVGWRVQVFWEGEAAWFDGVISEYSPEDGFFVKYDDGEEQWEVRQCVWFSQVTVEAPLAHAIVLCIGRKW